MEHWQHQLSKFLKSLLSAQQETITLLERKQSLFAANDLTAIETMIPQERQAAETLQQCLAERQKLLQDAAAEGLPSESVGMLARAVVPDQDEEFWRIFRTTQYQSSLLRQHNITNWVVTQRGLLHISQMLDIIAARGQPRPTYTRNHSKNIGTTGGSLMDRKA
ncbi:MAG: flagellar protein FlgN [Planctomycetaceae bacterium]|jgi:hypothetical protein|nr:flagellar protein FlgN [Planctomycetaceae bacterium]